MKRQSAKKSFTGGSILKSNMKTFSCYRTRNSTKKKNRKQTLNTSYLMMAPPQVFPNRGIKFKDCKISTEPSLTLKQNKTKQLDSRFEISVEKIFKSLDIFSKGTISEANINRWIPQCAIYFLGAVFQRIRQARIAMNLTQFREACLIIKGNSTSEDVQQFISSVLSCKAQVQQKQSLETSQKVLGQTRQIAKVENSKNTIRQEFQLTMHNDQNLPRQYLNLKNTKRSGFEAGRTPQDTVPMKNSELKRKIQFSPESAFSKHQYALKTKARRDKENIADDMPLKLIEDRIRKISVENEMDIQQEIEKSRERIRYLEGLRTEKGEQRKETPIKIMDRKEYMIQSPSFSYLDKQQIKQAAKEPDSAKLKRLSDKLEHYIQNNAMRIQRTKNILDDLL